MDWIFDRSSACSIAGVIGGGTESAITRHYGPRAVQIANVSYRFVVSPMGGEYGRPAAVRLHRLRASISLIHREPRVIDAFPHTVGGEIRAPRGQRSLRARLRRRDTVCLVAPPRTHRARVRHVHSRVTDCRAHVDPCDEGESSRRWARSLPVLPHCEPTSGWFEKRHRFGSAGAGWASQLERADHGPWVSRTAQQVASRDSPGPKSGLSDVPCPSGPGCPQGGS